MTAVRARRTFAAAALTAAVWACGNGPGSPPPPMEPSPPLCRIGGNNQPLGFPAVFATETCLSQGCFEEFAIRAVRYEPDGRLLEEQPGLWFEIAGESGEGPSCQSIIGRFVLDPVTLSHGGAQFRILQDCVSGQGLTVTIMDQRGECESWIVRLPDDVEPIPMPE